MAVEPRAHWAGEEQRLFAVTREKAEYARYIDALAAKHRDPAAFLDTLGLESAAQRGAYVRAVEELSTHLSKKEDGLFPAPPPAPFPHCSSTAPARSGTVR